ncbi:MAG: diaminopimelate decarboxylase [Bdellovibrio sp.]|nr:MAG: diaminopimelate decarboxylase [Bdellovibrio sp.]
MGKTEEEIRGALEFQIGQFNVESPQELLRVAKIAKSLGVVAPVAFRMNPDVNPQTHPYIRTGFRENKFGMDVSFLPQLEKILDSHPQALQLKGLTLHIGSQIQEMDPFKESIRKTWPLFLQLKEKYPSLRVFDVGGGLGIDYEKGDLQSEEQRIRHYGDFLNQFFSGKDDVEVICEPGRILVGPFGLLVTQVQYIKSTPYKNFAIVDTGMHHLIRPALYSAFHRIFPLRDLGTKDERDVYDVVGPICESADVLGKERVLPLLKQGDYLAIADVGAYGAVMSMSYNSHQLPKEYVFVNGEVKKA